MQSNAFDQEVGATHLLLFSWSNMFTLMNTNIHRSKNECLLFLHNHVFVCVNGDINIFKTLSLLKS
jgi:hypothetical protein